MDLEKFAYKKENMLNVLVELQNISEEIKNETITSRILSLIKQIKTDLFQVIVVGRFSRGKSTFINALLGDKILPSSKDPTTAVINKIIYGDRPVYKIFFKDGKPKEISEDEFKLLVAPEEVCDEDDPELSNYIEKEKELNKIDYVNIAYPLQYCKNNVSIVDTPGTDDLDQSRVDITYGYLDQADAVILLLAADQALSKGEIEFLKERILKNRIQDIFYIINRKDTLHGLDEETRVFDFVCQNLQRVVQKKINDRVFLVSSLQALLYKRQAAGKILKIKEKRKLPENLESTGFPEFQNVLTDYLANDKGEVRLNLYREKAADIINELDAQIKQKIILTERSSDEIIALIQKITPRLEKVKRETARILQNFESALIGNRQNLQHQCEVWNNKAELSLSETIDGYKGKVYPKGIKRAIDSTLNKVQKDFIENISHFESTLLNNEYRHAVFEIKKIWEDFEASVEDTSFHPHAVLKNDLIISEQEISDSDEDGNVSEFAAGAALAALIHGAIFPAFAFGALGVFLYSFFSDSQEGLKNKIKAKVLEQYRNKTSEVQQNILQQYDHRILELKERLNKSVKMNIDDLSKSLDDALRAKKESDNKMEKELSILNGYKDKLNSLNTSLANI